MSLTALMRAFRLSEGCGGGLVAGTEQPHAPFGQGQENARGGAAARLAEQFEMAAVFVENPLHDEEAEAGARFLAGEVGFGDVGHVLDRNAGAVVLEGNLQMGVGARGGDAQDAAVAERLHGIFDQVVKGLLELVGIGGNAAAGPRPVPPAR